MTELHGGRSLGFRLTLWAVYLISRVIMLTWRVRFAGLDNRRQATAANPHGSFVLATLHENAIAGLLTHPNQGVACLSSKSKDGEIVAFVCEKVGLRTVRGSSSRGGKEARDELVDLLNQGVSAAITVDGPRGPRRIAKSGIVDVARKSGARVVPITAMGAAAWVLRKTWDQTRIPKPFAKVLVRYGTPIFIPPDTEGPRFEAFQIMISNALCRDDEMAQVQFEKMWTGGQKPSDSERR